MDPNCKLFEGKVEVLSSGVDREEQGRVKDHIGLGWIEQSKYNQRIAEKQETYVDKGYP